MTTNIDRLREIIERIEETTESKPDMVAVPLDALLIVLRELSQSLDRLKALEAEHAEAIEVLMQLEWEGEKWRYVCPVCLKTKPDGHAADCKLAKLIKEREGSANV
jgi:DNA repair exonuclease SbcCD ATPase subunit